MHALLPDAWNTVLTEAKQAALEPETQRCGSCGEPAEFGIEHRNRFTWYCSKCMGYVAVHMMEHQPFYGSC